MARQHAIVLQPLALGRIAETVSRTSRREIGVRRHGRISFPFCRHSHGPSERERGPSDPQLFFSSGQVGLAVALAAMNGMRPWACHGCSTPANVEQPRGDEHS